MAFENTYDVESGDDELGTPALLAGWLAGRDLLDRPDAGRAPDEDGRAELAPAAGGVDSSLARLLAIISSAMADGTWSRLKACRDDDCQWAFYDRSKNRSGTWCTMAACGNRSKARAYRKRERTARTDDSH